MHRLRGYHGAVDRGVGVSGNAADGLGGPPSVGNADISPARGEIGASTEA